MNRILKIVGGPLKGAEIALVAGTKVKVGSGDGCDIIVADPLLEKAAFELEVAEDEVTIVTPDGAAKTMLDYEAKEFGASAFAIGAAEGKWLEIVWGEERNNEESSSAKATEDRSGNGIAGEIPPKADPLKKNEEADKGESSRPSRLVSLVLAAVVVAILLLLAIFWYLRFCRGCETRGVEVSSHVTLAAVAERYGLAVIETNGQFVIRGDLKCRSDRLAAMAAAFQAQPGVEIDLSDDESLFKAAEALIAMVAGDSLKVVSSTNRVVAFRGRVESAEEFRGILGAIDRDVPCVAKVDCREVVCDSGSVPNAIVAVDDMRPIAGESPRMAETVPAAASAHVLGRRKAAVSRLPVCGILTVPYPCIILKNGGRVSEGGEFGGYVVEKIRADALTLRDGARTFEWKP